MVAAANTMDICARPTPSNCSIGFRNTLKAYMVPIGRLSAVAATIAAAVRWRDVNVGLKPVRQ